MKKMTVTTGFGYYTDANGTMTDKYELAPGVYSLRDDLSYTEVSNKTILDAITFPEEVLSDEQKAEIVIFQKSREILRQQAIDALAADGILSAQQAQSLKEG